MKEKGKPCIEELESIALDLRQDIVEMIHEAGSGHPGGSLSICEILTVLYYHEISVDPGNPKDPERDRFILSKGHAAPALYAVLARKGYFPREELKNLRKINSILQGHPDSRKIPGVEISSGSLGMGISYGIGVALMARYDRLDYRTYVLVGCGELDEGQNWEAFLAASKYKLDNLVVIVDYNRVQLDGTNAEILPLDSLERKIESFNLNVIECNGHDIRSLVDCLDKARNTRATATVILAHTVKGKGISFMENKHEWHGRGLNEEEFEKAMRELSVLKRGAGSRK